MNLLREHQNPKVRTPKPFGLLRCELWDSKTAACPRAFLPDTGGRYKAGEGWAWLIEPPKRYGDPARLFVGYRSSVKELIGRGFRRSGSVEGYVCNGRGKPAKSGRYGV
jgi:hypothetical protein